MPAVTTQCVHWDALSGSNVFGKCWTKVYSMYKSILYIEVLRAKLSRRRPGKTFYMRWRSWISYGMAYDIKKSSLVLGMLSRYSAFNDQAKDHVLGLSPSMSRMDACDRTRTTYHTYPLLTHCQFIQARNITTKRGRETSGQASHSRCYTVPTVSQQLTR